MPAIKGKSTSGKFSLRKIQPKALSWALLSVRNWSFRINPKISSLALNKLDLRYFAYKFGNRKMLNLMSKHWDNSMIISHQIHTLRLLMFYPLAAKALYILLKCSHMKQPKSWESIKTRLTVWLLTKIFFLRVLTIKQSKWQYAICYQ